MPIDDSRLYVTGEELHARAIIAAALIQQGAIDTTKINFAQNWMEDEQLTRFNGVVQRLYDVIRRKR